MLITFVLIATIIFIGFAIIWNTSDGFNVLIKIMLIAMSLWGVGIILNNPNLFLVGT